MKVPSPALDIEGRGIQQGIIVKAEGKLLVWKNYVLPMYKHLFCAPFIAWASIYAYYIVTYVNILYNITYYIVT